MASFGAPDHWLERDVARAVDRDRLVECASGSADSDRRRPFVRVVCAGHPGFGRVAALAIDAAARFWNDAAVVPRPGAGPSLPRGRRGGLLAAHVADFDDRCDGHLRAPLLLPRLGRADG